MDLNSVERIVQPRARADLPPRESDDAYLAGGTWIFSEPQIGLRRLIDLTGLGWAPLQRTQAGLEVAATCTLATLEAFDAPVDWPAASLFGQCCRALVGSFKIRGQATVGGNICLALPAAPMVALAVALQADCLVWHADGGQRSLPAASVVTGAQSTALAAGDVLRSITLPEAALRRRPAFRQISLTPLGRSAALLIGMRTESHVELTITAAVASPYRLTLRPACPMGEVAARIDAAVPCWYDDVHGRPEWRRRVTHLLATEICAELA